MPLSQLSFWVFRLRADGAASDIDVAVLVEPGREDDFPILAFTAALERTCGQQVDLVLLNRAGELLKYHVRRYGRLIFEETPRSGSDLR